MYQFWIYTIALLLAIPCAVLGSFLLLRKSLMLSDAMSHAVVPGLVLGYLITKSLYSPWLLIVAALFGVITVYGVEWLSTKQHVKKDASIGVVFSFLFGVGILLIANFTSSNTDLHQECILYGDLGATPLNRLLINGINWGPKALYTTIVINIIVGIFVILFWRPLVSASFDPIFAQQIGLKPKLTNLLLMTIVSITIVSAFDLVGAVLIIGLLAIPAACAFLLTKNMKYFILTAIAFTILGNVLGASFAFHYNLVLSAAMALGLGLLFFLIFVLKRWLLKGLRY
jgi:manganese/zinc/iron transport system permease protein